MHSIPVSDGLYWSITETPHGNKYIILVPTTSLSGLRLLFKDKSAVGVSRFIFNVSCVRSLFTCIIEVEGEYRNAYLHANTVCKVM